MGEDVEALPGDEKYRWVPHTSPPGLTRWSMLTSGVRQHSLVITASVSDDRATGWIAGSSPAMTTERGEQGGAASVHRNVRVLHHLAPDRDVFLDLAGILLGRGARSRKRQLVEGCFHVGQTHDLGDLFLQECNNVARRSRRRQHAVDQIGF